MQESFADYLLYSEDEMTRDEILNMPAGREMDAEIIEKVFGRILIKPRSEALKYPHTDWGSTTVNEIPHFSTDIADAWEVVDKVPNPSQFFDCEKFEGKWTASFGGQYVVAADTAPLAICRAALLAVSDTSSDLHG